jgi:hypothetical protein
MNERIKEFAKQARGEFYTGFAGSPNSVKFMESDFEKFVELIMKECFDEIEKGVPLAGFARDRVLNHFGVEE